MANKSTQLSLRVIAINQASKVFKDISASAGSTIGKIARWGIGLGAAYFSAKGLASSIQEMGKLSDVATAAGASVEELTKLSQALESVGVKGAKPEELADSFLRLTKTTGKSGLAGFYEVMESISKLPSEQERAQAATAAFGRSGQQFLRLFSAGADGGIESLKTLVAGMAGVSDAAAESGDKVCDAWGFFSNQATGIWYEALGEVISYLDNEFEGGFREAALRGAAYMKYFAKAAGAYLEPFITNTKASFLNLAEWISRVMNNVLTIVGGVVVASSKHIWDEAGKLAFTFFGSVDHNFHKYILNDEAGAKAALENIRYNNKKVARETADNWDKTFKTFEDQLKWELGAGPLGDVNLEPLKKQLEADLKEVAETAKAQKDLQDRMNKSGRQQYGALGAVAGAAAKNVNPEALLGGTYKAVTFALRAGYATAQERIAKGVDKIATLLKDVKDNTAETAKNLNLQEIT